MAGGTGQAAGKRYIGVFGRRVRMPRARWARIAIGVVLILLSFLWFLPVLGLWMLPLGIVVLSYEFASVRRFRRRFEMWWHRKRRRQRREERLRRLGRDMA